MITRTLVLALAAGSLAGCGIFQKAGPKTTPTIGERRAVLGGESAVEADPSLAPRTPPRGDDDPSAYTPWIPDAEELISDLHEFEDVLDKLDDAGIRWHLSVEF